MKKPVRILRNAGLVLLVLVALTLLLIVLSRLTTPGAEQRAAVELMQQDELPDGPDAYGLLWTLERDVPLDEIDAVLRADVAKVAGWPEDWAADEAPGDVLREDTAWRRDDYPNLSPSQEDRDSFCRTDGETGCLAQVRAAPEATAQALARNEGLLARIQRLRDFEVLRNAMPAKLMAPMPAFVHGPLPMTAHALEFVQGNEHQAVAETCRDLAVWRQLTLNTDLVIGAMVGIAYAGRAYGELLAEMLAEWPVDRPLPEACNTALASIADRDLRLCHALRGEFRVQQGLFGQTEAVMQADSWPGRVLGRLVYDPESTVALAAEQLAPYCRPEVPGRPDHDWPDSRSEVLLRWDCVGNFLGCTMTGLGSGAVYGAYADRMLDFDARLRQLRSLAWMRTQAGSGERADALIERLPPDLRDENQPIELTPDGRGLRVALLDDRRGDWAEIPLPPALWSAEVEREE
ncbi:hypothetical protein [Halomonas denitrificans]|nr:hypothetical protein [Halomonas denitrificans]